MDNNSFTLTDSLKLQAEGLEGYKQLLKPHVYRLLSSWCEKTNKGITDPYAIKRGQDLSGFIEGLICEIRNSKINSTYNNN